MINYSDVQFAIQHNHQMYQFRAEADRERLARQLPRPPRRPRSALGRLLAWTTVMVGVLAIELFGAVGGLTPAASALQTQPTPIATPARSNPNAACSPSGDLVGDANPATIRRALCGG